jgi:hypothetical protein
MLNLTGSLASGVNVTGGTFRGSGTVNSPVIVGSGGTVRSDSGSLDVTGNLNVAGITELDLGGATNQSGITTNATPFLVTGTATFQNGSVFRPANDGTLAGHQAYSIVVATAGSFVAPTTFSVVSGSGAHAAFANTSLTFGSGNVTLNFTPVPEPATVMAFGAGVLGLVGAVRRRVGVPA